LLHHHHWHFSTSSRGLRACATAALLDELLPGIAAQRTNGRAQTLAIRGLGPDFTVHKANESFYHLFGLRPTQTEGKSLFEIGNGQWNILKLRQLLEEVLPRNKEVKDFALEATFGIQGLRKLLLNARRFYDEGWGTQMMLLAIEDVTEK